MHRISNRFAYPSPDSFGNSQDMNAVVRRDRSAVGMAIEGNLDIHPALCSKDSLDIKRYPYRGTTATAFNEGIELVSAQKSPPACHSVVEPVGLFSL